MFVEPGVQTSLTVHNKHWVGNWWLGFAIFGAICVFWSIWLLGFPIEFPLTRNQRKTDLCEEKWGTIKVGKVFFFFWLDFRGYGKREMIEIFKCFLHNQMSGICCKKGFCCSPVVIVQ